MSFEQSSAASETISARNERIRAILQSGRLPVLPFELHALERQTEELMDEQDELGRRLGEAMNQSSETWHDNHPAQAINEASTILSIRGRRLARVIEDVEGVDYPPDGEEVTIGSIVGVRFSGTSEVQHLLLTGSSTKIDETIGETLPEDCMSVTINSPIGKALLGVTEGSTVAYVAGQGRTLELSVETVSQFRIL